MTSRLWFKQTFAHPDREKLLHVTRPGLEIAKCKFDKKGKKYFRSSLYTHPISLTISPPFREAFNSQLLSLADTDTR